MTHEQIIETLEAAFAGQLSDCDTAHGISAITIPAASNLKVLQFLYDSEDLQSTNGTTISSVKSKQDEFKLIPKRLYQVLDGQSITFGPTSTILKISDSVRSFVSFMYLCRMKI